jgi:hypothetical protein
MARSIPVVGALLGVLTSALGAAPVEADNEVNRDPEGPGVFAAFGVGIYGLAFGGVSRLGDAAPSSGLPWTLQFGERLGRGLYLTEELETLDGLTYSPDPTVGESRVTLLAGVQWFPFRPHPQRNPLHFPRYLDPNAWYLSASIGWCWRDRVSMMTDTVTSTPAVAAEIGVLPLQGMDWALGYQFREQLEHYSDGFQRSWALTVVVQLHN